MRTAGRMSPWTGRVLLVFLLVALPGCRSGTSRKVMASKAAGSEMPGGFDSIFRAYRAPDSPGAGVLVVKDGEVVFAKAFGLANVEEKIPATTNTNYRLASLTKQF